MQPCVVMYYSQKVARNSHQVVSYESDFDSLERVSLISELLEKLAQMQVNRQHLPAENVDEH